jgi:biotin carboxyl carrier protein
LYKLFVEKGQEVKKKESLLAVDPIQMDHTVATTRTRTIGSITLKAVSMVTKDDLVLTLV